MTTKPGTTRPGDQPSAMSTGPGTGPADDILDAEPDAQETPVYGEADEHARRVDAYADQERLVRRFINVAHERLAGRDPGSRRLRGRQPRERVVLGVLAPQDPPAEPVVTVQDLPAEPGVPVDQLPASEFGLTCLVDPDKDVLTVDAAVRFALYLQHYPTYDEQLRHAAPDDSQDGAAPASTASAPAAQDAPADEPDDQEASTLAPEPGAGQPAGAAADHAELADIPPRDNHTGHTAADPGQAGGQRPNPAGLSALRRCRRHQAHHPGTGKQHPGHRR